MKFRASVSENLEWIADATHRAAKNGTDAILFPECAVTGYLCDFIRVSKDTVDRAVTALGKLARSARCNLLIGCPTFRGSTRFNSLLVLNRHGREIFRYSKIHLTPRDARFFALGNSIAYFHLDGIACTAIICHERRYPELVRLPVMLGAQILFHPNAGLDSWAVSRTKRGGRDGIAVRAFENQIYYVFANSVGPQGEGLWAAGDSKIVAPDSKILALANNRDEMIIQAKLDLSKAGRKYAREAIRQPAFLRAQWRSILLACRRRLSRARVRPQTCRA